MTTERITVGAQLGGPDVSDATTAVYQALKRQLWAHCTRSYSPIISEFAIVLRIDGSLVEFGGEGVQGLRIRRKDAYVTADYVIPVARWKDVPLPALKAYFAAAAVMTIEAMAAHLKKLKVAVDAEMLTEDVKMAAGAFLDAPVPA